ncbi:MAG: Asp-tRNA(Asn)/Glu-tRNA(Gln) amidotransferase subunit GatC [Candidatus Acidiferrales bacterium]
MKITPAEVLRVAQLAHLELSPEELETYRGQLDEILTYIGKLEEIDVSNIEPMAQVIFKSPIGVGGFAEAHPELRDDTPRDCHTAAEVLKTAPDAAAPFFRVPKVIER